MYEGLYEVTALLFTVAIMLLRYFVYFTVYLRAQLCARAGGLAVLEVSVLKARCWQPPSATGLCPVPGLAPLGEREGMRVAQGLVGPQVDLWR